jgi:hypothetical protein
MEDCLSLGFGAGAGFGIGCDVLDGERGRRRGRIQLQHEEAKLA